MWELPGAGLAPIDLPSCHRTSERVSGLEPEAESFEVVVEDVAVHQRARHRVAVSRRPRHLPERRHGDEISLAAIMKGRPEVITAVRFAIEDEAVIFLLVHELTPPRPVLDKRVEYRERVVDVGLL